MSSLKERLSYNAEFIEKTLDKLLSKDKLNGGNMAEAMRYATLGGGKRIRAFLAIEFCRLFGGDEERAAYYASAVEMVHAYSLVHDDLPAMDNDDMRRGKPSCHKAFGESCALLAGDALLTYAFEVCASAPLSSEKNALAVRTLAKCAGAAGMCGGQELDLMLDCPDYESLKKLHYLKTGELICAAATLGYIASPLEYDSATAERIADYALSLGLAFQIEDDLLDVRSTTEELGKPVGSDEKNGKKTVLSYMSVEEADAEAKRLSTHSAGLFADMEGGEVVSELPVYLLSRKK
ncbi:MAG: polyprenyl synthetase family protein [Ruminococcaceae bacterium]|nr:polyprenyl synthetase family protein [Oscillospiraceae bacterium]